MYAYTLVPGSHVIQTYCVQYVEKHRKGLGSHAGLSLRYMLLHANILSHSYMYIHVCMRAHY